MAVAKSISWIYTVAELYIHSCPSIMAAQKKKRGKKLFDEQIFCELEKSKFVINHGGHFAERSTKHH